MASVTLGLIGLGTVGSGVVRLLRGNGELIRHKTGIEFRLKRIADRGIGSVAGLDLSGVELHERAEAVLADPEIEIVIELIGGLEPARSYLLDAIHRGKHVVTANKALLATYGGEIFSRAGELHVEVGFEGSVAGTVPVLRVLSEGLAANRIESVLGIVNGTTNYVLTRMEEEGLSYAQALGQAQALGFAEADPTLDVDGEDAAHKLAILATLAFGVRPRREDILVEGIRGIAADDLRFARANGFVVKLLAVGRKDDGSVELRVHPTLVPRVHPLAAVRHELNAVFVRGDASQETMYYGRGAGSLPTASAVLSDVIEIAKRMLHDCRRPECRAHLRAPRRALYWSRDRFTPADEIRSRYYLRLPIDDAPGAIGSLTTVLGRHQVSIAAVQAAVVDPVAHLGRIEVLTHEAREGDLRKALAAMQEADLLRGDAAFLRVLE